MLFKKKYKKMKETFIKEIVILAGSLKINNYEMNSGVKLCTIESLKKFQESLRALNDLESKIIDSRLKNEDKLFMIKMIVDHRNSLEIVEISFALDRIKKIEKASYMLDNKNINKIDVPKFSA